jgi:S-adenosylmethionine-diacylglycerol 3-amino-3-carboxypropyl transferase
VFKQAPSTGTKPGEKTRPLPQIRYAQCWEDADVLLSALQVKAGDACLSIASGGENCLSLLSRSPAKVVAIDCNPAQLALLELKVAAFRNLSHAELLMFLGSHRATAAQRSEWYGFCAGDLQPATVRYWRNNSHLIENGVSSAGKFESYFRLFREVVLPLIHDRKTVEQLCVETTAENRHQFYLKVWNTWRWRALFSMFFSRKVMGKAGRDPQLFNYVQGEVSAPILDRVQHGLTEVAPDTNPYLHWILFGEHRHALPHALRAENFESIRSNLDRLQWHCLTADEYLEQNPGERFDCFNLSDIFEYMSESEYFQILNTLIAAANDGARLAYWNMLVERHASEEFARGAEIVPRRQEAASLLKADKAFFYGDFVLEEVRRT